MNGTLSQRLTGRLSQALAPRQPGRRRFLQRAAVVGTALAVNPLDFIMRPGTAYASVCGPANECGDGWSAFCVTINGGANTCPEGSYAAGWWKVSSSAFCRGGDRYVVDCNRLPQAQCACHCAEGDCDRRRVCCNNFRYGQCNQQIAGTTPVVCRLVICTPPWEWDETCTTTVRTNEPTRDHNATGLNGPNPTVLMMAYQDLGLVGSPLGAPTAEEIAGPGGGTWREFEHGVMTWVEPYGVVALVGAAAARYVELEGPNGELGWLAGEATPLVNGGQVAPAEHGAIVANTQAQAFVLRAPLHTDYEGYGGPGGWLGFPVTDDVDAPGGRRRVFFQAGWSLAHDPTSGETRLLPSDVELADQAGVWPATTGVARWDGDDRVATAVRVSMEARPDGAPMAVLASATSFPDALAGGVLAGVLGGPVLLTAQDQLSTATAEELRRLQVDRVVVVGGEVAIDDVVVTQVAVVLPEASVERLAGENRFATAAAIADAVLAPDGAPTFAQGGGGGGSNNRVAAVYLASGKDFPDALAASPAAAAAGVPVLLTELDQLPDATRAALERYSPEEVVVVGGENAVNQFVMDEAAEAAGGNARRIAGFSRYDTAAAVAEATSEGLDVQAVMLATGADFPDALAAGAAAKATSSALLLVAREGVPKITREAISRLGPGLLVAIGGTIAVSDLALLQLANTPVEPYEQREDPAHPSGSNGDTSGGEGVPDPEDVLPGDG